MVKTAVTPDLNLTVTTNFSRSFANIALLGICQITIAIANRNPALRIRITHTNAHMRIRTRAQTRTGGPRTRHGHVDTHRTRGHADTHTRHTGQMHAHAHDHVRAHAHARVHARVQPAGQAATRSRQESGVDVLECAGRSLSLIPAAAGWPIYRPSLANTGPSSSFVRGLPAVV